MRIRALVFSTALLTCGGALSAQSPTVSRYSPYAPAQQWRSFIGANPLGIPFDIVSVEAETTIGVGATIGAVGSYNDIDRTRYTTFDARFKYYPGEVALQGFSAGMSLGFTRFDAELASQPTPQPTTPARGKLSANTLGVLVDYNWTQGPSQRFVVGTGVGAKRVLADTDKREALGLDRAYLTARFVIGLLF